jgi:AcrR family transcriptional regulator
MITILEAPRSAKKTSPSTLGLRERKKIDKLRRIKAAATELFKSKGFAATTTIEIAERAGVAEGTLFLYAEDKRDLLFEIGLEQLERTRKRGFAKIDPLSPLLEQLMAPEVALYRHVAKDLRLHRILCEETAFCNGRQASRIRESRRRFIKKIEDVIVAAEHAGQIRCDENTDFVAQHIFYSSLGAYRWWIALEKPKVAEALAGLRRVYRLHLRALNAKPSAFA